MHTLQESQAFITYKNMLGLKYIERIGVQLFLRNAVGQTDRKNNLQTSQLIVKIVRA